MRIDLCFHVGAKRRERIERFRPRPLAFAILYRPIADVLRRGVPKNISSSGRRCHVAHPPSNDNRQLRLKIGSMIWKGHFDLASVGDQRSAGLDPNQGLFGQWFPAFPRMIGIIQTDRDDFGRCYRDKSAHPFELHRFFLERGRPKNISAQRVNLAIDNFGVKNRVALLKSANR